MGAKELILHSLNMSDRVLTAYVNDLDDADFLMRPIEGMNPIAWQLGHLISTERHFVEELKPGASPPLPDGFAKDHDRESANSPDTSRFRKKAEYLSLYQAQRAATKAVVEGLSEAELEAPGPERFREWCPTVATTLLLNASHATMHAGQFVAVRRKSGKPVVI